jgi:hypothetical protein
MDFLAADSQQIGAHHNKGTGTLPNAERLTGPDRKIIDAFRQRDESGGLSWCRHLKPGSPQPAVWLAWRPSRLYCLPCVPRLPQISSKEDRRCDACRTIVPKIHPCRMMAPARPLPARQGKPEEVRPPVIMMYGLCGRCRARGAAARAELVDSTPCRFRLLPVAQQAPPQAADLFRAAVALTRAVDAHDQDAIVAAGGSHDPRQLLWATAHLVIAVTETLGAQGEWREDAAPPDPAELWESIPATLHRWEGYGPDTGLSFPELRQHCGAAVGLIKRVHRGEREALADLTTVAAAVPVLAGAAYVLAAVVSMPVVANLAGNAEQVWAAVLEGIDRWESGDD